MERFLRERDEKGGNIRSVLTILLAVDTPQVTLQIIPVARACLSRGLGRTIKLASSVGVVVPSSAATAVLGFEVSASAAAATGSAWERGVST